MSRYGRDPIELKMEYLYDEITSFINYASNGGFNGIDLVYRVVGDAIENSLDDYIATRNENLIEERDFYRNKYDEIVKVLSVGK